jgi:hypothetical protein
MRDRTELNTILNKENDKHLSSFLQVKLFQHFGVNAEAIHSIVMGHGGKIVRVFRTNSK